jgi:hypothetical protein
MKTLLLLPERRLGQVWLHSQSPPGAQFVPFLRLLTQTPRYWILQPARTSTLKSMMMPTATEQPAEPVPIV